MAIPIPGLPTDNLYKFLAIGGIVLIVVGAYINLRAGEARSRQEAEATYQQTVSRLDSVEDQVRIQVDTTKLKRILLEAQRLKPRERQVKGADLTFQREDSLLAAFYAVTSSNIRARDSTKLNEARTEREQAMDYIPEYYDHIEKMADLGYWLGSLLAGAGFVGWYFKVQRFQDAILRKQAEDAGVLKKTRTES